MARPGAEETFGLSVGNLTAELAEQPGYLGNAGVVVKSVETGSTAEKAGIRPGMLIEEVNRQMVSNVSEFQEALGRGKGNKNVLLLVRDGRAVRYIVLSR